MKGYTWGWYAGRGEFLRPQAAESMQALVDAGCKWVVIPIVGHMKTSHSPEIAWGDADKRSPSDAELRHAISMARRHKLKVGLKPVVDSLDGTWRAKISFDQPEGWQAWWHQHEAFHRHYAKIAAAETCELYCVGCEMSTTELAEKPWRKLVTDVRAVYSGPVAYQCNFGREGRIEWWDAVDLIGVSGYYPVGKKDDTSAATMLAGLAPIRDRLAKLRHKWHRPVAFLEVGVRSAHTCSTRPWDWTHKELPYDGREQADYYEAVLKTFYHEPWFCGFAWWDWPAQLYPRKQAEGDRSFCCFGKPADKVLRTWYARQRNKLN